MVFFVGDFCFKNSSGGKEGEGITKSAESYLEQLNGNITFIRGNHDKTNSLNALISHAEIIFGGEKMWLVHDPEEVNTKYKINLVGHVHDLWKVKRIAHTYIVNVGVDMWKFYPVNLQEIQQAISEFKKGGKK